MRKLLFSGVAFAALVAGPAMAADLPGPVYRAAVIAAPLFSWTGFYIGAHVGAGFSQSEFTNNLVTNGISVGTFTPVTTASSQMASGALGGGQVGFNYQVGPTVWGAEFQYSGSNIDGNGACQDIQIAVNNGFLGGPVNCHTKVTSLGSIAGRIGLASDHLMVYAKGGAAFAREQYDLVSSIPIFLKAGGLASPAASLSDTRWGWMFGTGLEYAFWGPWSVKVEYNYLDFGTKTYNFASGTPCGGPGATSAIDCLGNSWDNRERIHLVKFGINYRFGSYAAAVVTK